jgi:hypothetical protein
MVGFILTRRVVPRRLTKVDPPLQRYSNIGRASTQGNKTLESLDAHIEFRRPAIATRREAGRVRNRPAALGGVAARRRHPTHEE